MFIVGYNSLTCPTAIWNNTVRVIAGITGVPAASATTLNGAQDLAFDANNTLYVTDYYNARIQKFIGGSATAVTVPGLTLSYPAAIQVGNNGGLYISDSNNYRILRVLNGNVTVVAGGRGSGSGVDQIGNCLGIYVDSNNNIYVSDYSNHRVGVWNANNPNISQVVCFF